MIDLINLGVEIGETFHRDKLNDSWEPAAIAECNNNRYSSPENTLNGMAAEQYAIQYCNHVDDPRKYRDTTFNNLNIEHKSKVDTLAYPYKVNMSLELEKLKRKKLAGDIIGDYIICWRRTGRTYECESQWKWNGRGWKVIAGLAEAA